MNFFRDKKGKEKRATVFDWINELFVGKRDWDGFKDVDKKKKPRKIYRNNFFIMECYKLYLYLHLQ